ncbi:suppressor of fused domain protein [Streptomyces hydrogenans]|uniref:suppressor of fused domain protein n=1 Tax=Streptomyces hydrogenans TaxID=1873719 RepID=UPI0036359062
MLIEGYESAPLVAGDELTGLPGFWAAYLLWMCRTEENPPEPSWFGADEADTDAAYEALADETRWPVFRIPFYAHHLDVEHSLPIGEPWLPGSACDHLLISLPYLHGPELEHCPVPGGHARVLWALPVTAAEMDYRREHGNEALERLFDEHAILPNDPKRPSVV